MAQFKAQESSLPLTRSAQSIFLAAHHSCKLIETTSDDLRANKRRGSHTPHLLPRVEPLISGVANSMPARLYALKLHTCITSQGTIITRAGDLICAADREFAVGEHSLQMRQCLTLCRQIRG